MKPPLYLNLMRHGETESGSGFRGQTNDLLTTKGWDQMWMALEHQKKWDSIISSPLLRCADFANALAQQQSIPVSFDERLTEINFGSWEGRSAEEIMLANPDALTRFWNDPVQNPPPNGESLTNFVERVLTALNDIIGKNHGNILIIAHGGVIRVILCHLTGHPVHRLFDIDVQHAEIKRLEL